jgi:hypothetical protein
MFFNGEFFKHLFNKNASFVPRLFRNMTQLALLPWTYTTYRIHSLSGQILHINNEGKRPYVKAIVNGYGRNFLYDTGASKTCMSMATFRNAFPHGTPRKLKTNAISDQLYDAGGNSLGCIGVFEMDFEVLGRKFKHPVRVLQYVTEDIIGIDFINTHHLWYDPENREIFSTKQETKLHYL